MWSYWGQYPVCSAVEQTSGLLNHKIQPIQFTLVVDNFGVKYVAKEHAKHLLGILKDKYPGVEEDWTEEECIFGVTLKLNYDEGYLDIVMPGYIKKLLKKYNYKKNKKQTTIRTLLNSASKIQESRTGLDT